MKTKEGVRWSRSPETVEGYKKPQEPLRGRCPVELIERLIEAAWWATSERKRQRGDIEISSWSKTSSHRPVVYSVESFATTEEAYSQIAYYDSL